MLGRLVDSLDDPQVARGLLAALQQTALVQRLSAAAEAERCEASDLMAWIIRHFLDHASDDDWVQLMAIIGRAGDPGIAAILSILERALPRSGAAPA